MITSQTYLKLAFSANSFAVLCASLPVFMITTLVKINSQYVTGSAPNIFLSYHHLSFRALCKGASSKSAAEEVAVVEDDGAYSGIVREFCLMRLGHDPAPHC